MSDNEKVRASPAKWRKKPVVIEAMLFDGTEESASAICRWANAEDAAKGHDDPTVSYMVNGNDPGKAHDMVIWTLEGDMTALPGDWIIRGVKGEHYPCKPDIFAATYEEAALAEQPAGGGVRPFAYAQMVECDGNDGELKLYLLPPGHELPEGSLALYTTPPASIPAAEVQALVERWRAGASVCSATEYGEGARDALNQSADELAKLIPRNPE